MNLGGVDRHDVDVPPDTVRHDLEVSAVLETDVTAPDHSVQVLVLRGQLRPHYYIT